jgi:3-oxoadipate enol-lactonase
VRLAHRLDGPDGAPVLALAGSLGTTTALWEPQLNAFTAGFRVLRVDLPGHGRSPVPEERFTVDDIGHAALRVLDELELDRVSVCGLSLGGMVGMWLGANAPQRVERLVLACTGAALGTPEAWAERAALVRSEGMHAVLDGSRERWFSPAFRDSTAARRYLDELLTLSPEGYARCCEALGAFDFRADLARVVPPTLVVYGEQDTVITSEVVETLALGIPGARRTGVEAGHLANLEQPEEFASAVLGHLSERRAA